MIQPFQKLFPIPIALHLTFLSNNCSCRPLLPRPAVLSAMQSDTLETDILTETETRLAEYCTAQCRQQFGLDASVTVTLEKAGQQVVVKKVVAAFPAGCTAAQKQAALSFLQQTLGTAPTAAEGSTP